MISRLTVIFFENMLGLELEWRNEDQQIAMFRFPSGQEYGVFALSNRTRNAVYCHWNGPVLGLTVEDINLFREDLHAKARSC